MVSLDQYGASFADRVPEGLQRGAGSPKATLFHALTGISGISLPRIFVEGSQQIARRWIRQASLQISWSSPTIRTRLTNLRSRTLLSCEPWPVAKLSIKRDALLLLRKLRNAVKVGVG